MALDPSSLGAGTVQSYAYLARGSRAMTGQPSELAQKRARLHAVLDREGLDAIVLRAPHDLAWWSCGGRGHIVVGDPVGAAAVVITRDSETVLTTTTEAARMRDEE